MSTRKTSATDRNFLRDGFPSVELLFSDIVSVALFVRRQKTLSIFIMLRGSRIVLCCNLVYK